MSGTWRVVATGNCSGSASAGAAAGWAGLRALRVESGAGSAAAAPTDSIAPGMGSRSSCPGTFTMNASARPPGISATQMK